MCIFKATILTLTFRSIFQTDNPYCMKSSSKPEGLKWQIWNSTDGRTSKVEEVKTTIAAYLPIAYWHQLFTVVLVSETQKEERKILINDGTWFPFKTEIDYVFKIIMTLGSSWSVNDYVEPLDHLHVWKPKIQSGFNNAGQFPPHKCCLSYDIEHSANKWRI